MGFRAVMAAALVAAIGLSTAVAAAPAKPGPKYTPAQIEAMKRENEKAMAQNALITQALNAMNGKDWAAALGPLNQLIAADPGNWRFYRALGDAQYNLGHYEEAVEAYGRGVAAVKSSAKPDDLKARAAHGAMLTQLGNASLKLKRTDAALAAFQEAASLDPSPGVAYFNLCATMYNTGNVQGALGACDKAIKADPAKADAYFIKGSLLIADAKLGPNNTLQAPPGTVEALKKYLELAPEGPHAGDVKEMLSAVGAKVTTTYQGKK